MEEKELWMNKLKEKLEDYSEPIPASGWEQLEKELMPPVERKIYPYRKWMMAAAAVILLALVSSVSLYFLGTPAADEIRHTQTPALASVPNVQKPYGTVALKHWQKKEKTTVSARLITLLYLPFHHTKPDISTKKTN
jgi:hypothetical protein